jgi:hypothetical protein
MTIETRDSPYLLLSANYAFESEARAEALGIHADALTQPRGGQGHRHLGLQKSLRIPGEDWRKRQSELNRVLNELVQSAKAHSISLPAEGINLSLRISFITEDDEQLGFALASDFLRAWAELGGHVYIDN